VAWAKEAGLRTHASFMVGLPGESPQTLAETRRFGESLGIEHGYHFLSPFPGTTIMEKLDQYDLQILTDDWNLYDANQAIVRTSQIGPEEMNQFVANAYMKEQDKRDQVETRYLQNNCTDEEYIMFEGFYRTKLAFDILSQDLINENQLFPNVSGDSALPLIEHIATTANADTSLVDRTIRKFIADGRIKSKPNGKGTYYYWTHNNRMDIAPHRAGK